MRKIKLLLPLLLLLTSCSFCCQLYLCQESAAEKLKPYQGEKVQVTGYIDYASLSTTEDSSLFLLQVQELKLGDTIIPYHQKLRITYQGQIPEVGILQLEGSLKELITYENPGCFDAVTYHKVQELGGRIARPQLLACGGELTVGQRIALYNYQLRTGLQKSLNKLGLEEKYAPILAGMVLGGSSQLEEDTKQLFIANGLAHLLSVSGSHLILLCTLLRSLLLLLSKPFPQYRRFLNPLLIIAMLFYALLCGLRPPILRAVTMSIILLLVQAPDKHHTKVNRSRLILFAALLLLCIKPLWLFDLGFQLSFCCTLGITCLTPLLQEKLQHLTLLDENIKQILSTTLAAQLAALPLEIAYFHQFSLIAVISNLILVPILELCTLLTLTSLFTLDIFLLPTVFLLKQVLLQAQLLTQLPYSTVVIGHMPLWTVPIYYSLLLLCLQHPFFYSFRASEQKLLCLGLLLPLACSYWYEHLRVQPLQAYFLSVGQGDATLLRMPKGQLIIIDTGGLAHYPTGSRIIAPVAKYLNKDSLDLVILTHWDFDHVGGIVSLAQQLTIKKLVYPDQQLTPKKEDQQNKELKEIILALPNIKEKIQARTGDTYVCDNINLSLLHTGDSILTGNAASTVISVDNKILLTGDLPKEQEKLLQLGPHEVLKLGHHGSNTSTSDELLDKVQPKIGIVSCGRGNIYGHPHKHVLNRLESRGCQIYRTDLEGCIKIIIE